MSMWMKNTLVRQIKTKKQTFIEAIIQRAASIKVQLNQ